MHCNFSADYQDGLAIKQCWSNLFYKPMHPEVGTGSWLNIQSVVS
jgi:hypothetical protein